MRSQALLGCIIRLNGLGRDTADRIITLDTIGLRLDRSCDAASANEHAGDKYY